MTSLFFEEDQRYEPGHSYLPHDHEGLVTLTRHWDFGVDEVGRASTWGPTVLVAASPNLKEILDAVQAAPLKEWQEQIGSIDFASIHSGPVLSRPIEEAVLGLIDSLDPLLRSGITAAVPWLGKPRHSDLLSRLVFACTQTLLQRGREVVCGRAAYAVGRADCSVLCRMASDLKLYNEVGVRPTLFSVINLISPQCGQGFGVSTQLFCTRFDANYKLRSNLFLKRQLRLGTIELSAFLPPRCPNGKDAPPLLNTRCPRSIAMRVQQARFLVAIASTATHYTHSNCTPSRQLKVAEHTGYYTEASAVAAGEELCKEQCLPCLLTLPHAGLVLGFCPASMLGLDLSTVYPVDLHGLKLALSPAGLNLALLLAQPPARNTSAQIQAFLLAQVISRVCGDLRGSLPGDTQLLSAQQLELKDAICQRFYNQFKAETLHLPNYS